MNKTENKEEKTDLDILCDVLGVNNIPCGIDCPYCNKPIDIEDILKKVELKGYQAGLNSLQNKSRKCYQAGKQEQIEKVKEILKGCGKKFDNNGIYNRCGKFGINHNYLYLCPECKATLKAKYECWKNEIEERERLLARSGWEMLPAKMWNDDVDSGATKYAYHQGAKEMEEIWHEIIREEIQALTSAIEEVEKSGEGK